MDTVIVGLMNRYILLFLFAVFGLSSCAAPGTGRPMPPLKVPLPAIFHLPNVTLAPRIKLFKREILTLKDGDFVHPQFSPNGDYLAFSKVMVRNGIEGTEVQLMDVRTKNIRTLLGEKEAFRYSVYKVYVVELVWLSDSTLAIDLSDGDVEITRVVMDIQTNKIISVDYDAGNRFYQLTNDLKNIHQEILDIFPGWQPSVLATALQDRPLIIPGRGLLTKIEHFGYSDDILLFDTKQKNIIPILKIADHSHIHFSGGVYVNHKAIFALAHIDFVYIFDLDKNVRIRLLAKYPLSSFGAFVWENVNLKHESIFRLQLHHTYEEGHNPVFYVSEKGMLYELADCTNCYDYSVTRTGQMAAFSIWNSGKRMLRILSR